MGKNKLQSTAVIIVSSLFVVFGIYAYTTGGPNSRSIEGDRLQATPENFVYVSADEARELLARSRDKGEFKFIFPQINLSGVENFTIENHEVETKIGRRIVVLGIHGLPPDTEIYSNIDGTLRASALEYEKSDTQSLVIFTGEAGGAVSEFYIPYIPGLNDVSPEARGIVDTTFGAPLSRIPDGAELENEVFPEGWQMALIIHSLGGDTSTHIEGSRLENILTKGGRIVMIER